MIIIIDKQKIIENTYAAIDLDNVQRSIDAWYFKLSICFRKASLSMVARDALSIVRVRYTGRASEDNDAGVLTGVGG